MFSKSQRDSYIILLILLLLPVSAFSITFDASPSWPLCGRVAEAPPEASGWSVGQNCPAQRIGSAQYTDFPLSSTFGPRQLVSGGYRYDFHRGLDIPTATGTPVFAVADGIVRKSGVENGYSDPVIMIRHFSADYTGTSCKKSGGCYHSLYLHMNSVEVEKGANVTKGDLIGYSGASASGFEHLHFEIRQALSDDPYSSWQRDAVHPLSFLPHDDQASNSMDIAIDEVTQTDSHLQVSVTLTIAMNELDLRQLRVTVFDNQSGDDVLQPGNTANAKGYHINPPWFDVAVLNREYTHKDSSKVTWASYGAGGSRECPFHGDHGGQYEANVHMDKAADGDFQVADFNGLLIAPNHYNANSSEYVTTYTFKHLVGAEGGMEQSCVVIEAEDVGGAIQSVDYNCGQ